MNWHEYPQWRPQSLSTAVPLLGNDGLDLLLVSTLRGLLFFKKNRSPFVLFCFPSIETEIICVRDCSKCCSTTPLNESRLRSPWNILTLMTWTRPTSEAVICFSTIANGIVCMCTKNLFAFLKHVDVFGMVSQLLSNGYDFLAQNS